MRRWLWTGSACLWTSAILTSGAGAAPAAPLATTPTTEVASSGNVRAQLSYVKVVENGFTSYRDVRLTISRDGRQVASTAPQGQPGELPWPGYAWKPGAKSVHVADVDGDHDPEVMVDLYSGGLHCCRMLWAYRWNGTAYAADELDSGSESYAQRDLNRDGKPEWVTVDPRFEYLFTSFSGSGVPVRIFAFSGGAFVVVTPRYKSVIRTDTARWWRLYLRGRAQHQDTRGFLAPWAADQYLLGAGAKVWPALDTALARGDLKGPRGDRGDWPTGRAYITKLRQKLTQFGYVR